MGHRLFGGGGGGRVVLSVLRSMWPGLGIKGYFATLNRGVGSSLLDRVYASYILGSLV